MLRRGRWSAFRPCPSDGIPARAFRLPEPPSSNGSPDPFPLPVRSRTAVLPPGKGSSGHRRAARPSNRTGNSGIRRFPTVPLPCSRHRTTRRLPRWAPCIRRARDRKSSSRLRNRAPTFRTRWLRRSTNASKRRRRTSRTNRCKVHTEFVSPLRVWCFRFAGRDMPGSGGAPSRELACDREGKSTPPGQYGHPHGADASEPRSAAVTVRESGRSESSHRRSP